MIIPNIWMGAEVMKFTKFLQVRWVVSTSKFSDCKGFALSKNTLVFFLQIRF